MWGAFFDVSVKSINGMSERGSADEKSWTGCSGSYNFEYFTEKCQMPIERDCSDLEEQRHWSYFQLRLNTEESTQI